MAQKYFADQFDDEEVLYVFRRHPIVMRKGLIIFMAFLLLGTLPVLFDPRYGVLAVGLAAGAVLGLLVYLPWWIGWYFSVFILTNQRFIQITQKGLFHRSVADVNLPLIQSINYEISGFEQTVLGFGTIIMQTYVGDSKLHTIYHPAKVQRRLVELMRQTGVTPKTHAINARVLKEAAAAEGRDTGNTIGDTEDETE